VFSTVLRRRSAAMAKPKAARQRAITRMCTRMELLPVSPIAELTLSLGSLSPPRLGWWHLLGLLWSLPPFGGSVWTRKEERDSYGPHSHPSSRLLGS
jgi:hypothetical protein